MKTYEFAIVLDASSYTDEEAGRLYEAGCDDSTISRQGGSVFVEFDRESESLREAILSAIREVQKAGFKVARIETEESVTVNELNEQLQAV